MEYAHRGFIVSMNRADEDGTLVTISGDIPYQKGEIILTDLDGHTTLITENRFKELYFPVQRVKKPDKKQLSPFEEMYAQQIAEFNGTLEQDESDLHIKNELVSDKAF